MAVRTLYCLALADVHGKVEVLRLLAFSTSKERLEAWEQSQRAPEPYDSHAHADHWGRIHPYRLVYKDGPLKWFNPASEGFGGIFPEPCEIPDSELKAAAPGAGIVWVD